MLLGKSQFGSAVLGSDTDAVSFKIWSEAGQVAVTVATGSPTITVIVGSATATVTVTGLAPEVNTGSNSFPEAVEITVETHGARAGAKLGIAQAAVTVTVANPTVSAVSQAPVVAVPITVSNPEMIAVQSPAVVAITAAADSPAAAGVSVMEPAAVTVTGVAPETLVVSTPAGVAIVTVGVSPAVAAMAVPELVPVTITLESPAVLGVQAPPKVIVWVTAGTVLEVAETAQGLVVVLNANTLAVSEYDIAGVLDVVEHEGDVYFVTETGLSKLADPADADEGAVASYIQTGDLTLMSGHRINLWRAHMDLSADAPMRVTTRLDMAGQERDIAYTVPERSSSQSRARMVELARGPRAERWAIKIGTTEAGGNWAIDSLAVVPGATKRGR